jgi:hypothetical protein
MDKFIKKSKKHEIFYYEKKLKKLFSLGIIFLLLAPAFLSFLPVPQVKAEKDSTQEFWVPLVFSKAWSGDFGHSIEIYKIEDSEYFVERGSLNNPSIGTHIVVTKGSIMASYFWLNNDLGAWDDDVLGYTILPSSKLGTEYLIPVGGTVSVVATQPYTTVSYKGGDSPKILVDAGSYFQFVSSDGGWIKADKPVAVAVGNVDVKTKSDTYAYAPLPNNLLGTHYHFSKREPMDSYFKNQADLSKLVIMATEQGAKVSIGGEALSLSAYGFKVIENPSKNMKITSDKPISVVYLQRIRYTDPWTGDVRYASYAYSLIPKNLWGTSYILFEGWKYHLITEETVNVQIGEKPTRQYSAGVHDLGFQDKTSVIKSDKPINLVKIAISRWAGKYFPRGDAYEVFPTEFYTPFMHPLIKNALEAINSLDYGLKISAEKVSDKIKEKTKELPLKVLLSATNLLIGSLPIKVTDAKLILYIDGSKITVALNSLIKFTIARLLKIPVEKVTEKVLEGAKDKTIKDLYDQGGYKEHFDNIRKIITSLNEEFLKLPQDIMNEEFIKDFNSNLILLQGSHESYSNQIDRIIKIHEKKSFERNVLITAGALGIIIITSVVALPLTVVVAAKLGYFVITFLVDLKSEHDFIQTLANTWYGYSIDALGLSVKIVDTLQYILNKLKRSEAFPKIGYELDTQHGIVWMKNEGKIPVKIMAKYNGELRTYPFEQTYVNPIQNYGGYLDEFTLDPNQKFGKPLFKPEYDKGTEEWLKKATGYGLTVYERGFFTVEYGEEGSGAFVSKGIGPITAEYKPFELRDKEIKSVLMKKGTMPMPLDHIIVTLIEPKAQKKLYLFVYDDEGNYVGLDKKTGEVNIGITGAYYVDFDYGITIMLPMNTKLKKIVVDAGMMEENIGKYNLTTIIYKEGVVINLAEIFSSITKGQTKEYNFQLTGDLKPILNEQTTTLTTPSATTPPNIELIIIIIVIAAILASLVIVFRKYKAK